MNVGIIGWWHYGNEGDFRILDCMTRALEPHRVVPIDLPFPLNEDSLQRLNLLDFIILGGGGLFQAAPLPQPFDNFDAWGDRLQTPIGVAGVGIDAILPEHKAPISALMEQAQFFYVRDRTSQQIAGHPKVQVAPDLTFLYPLQIAHSRVQSQYTAPVCGVNVRQSHGIAPGPWMSTLKELPFPLRGIPMASYESWQEIELLRELDPASPAAFDTKLYQGLELMIGMAFHSVVFAIQAAIPVIGIAYAPKVRCLMTDIGLERFVLEPDEWQRLPQLVEDLRHERNDLSDHLQETSRRLSDSAWQAIAAIGEKVKRAGKPKSRSRARVSIVVVGSRSNRHDQVTLGSCLAQTHSDLEVILATDNTAPPPDIISSDPRFSVVQCEPQKNLGERLNQALAQATGDLLSWIVAGDCYALDAVSCMAHRLQDGPGCDMVFTDYYHMRETDLIASSGYVDTASKLFRRDVIGPCFMYRRELGEAIGLFSADAELIAYDYWLRARSAFDLRPIHSRLFYALSTRETANVRWRERQTRQQWRSTKPMPSRLLWQIVDSEILERLFVQPLQALRNRLRAMLGTSIGVGRSIGFRS